jgi:hypothetical protein
MEEEQGQASQHSRSVPSIFMFWLWTFKTTINNLNVNQIILIPGLGRTRANGTQVLPKVQRDLTCTCVPQCKSKLAANQKMDIFQSYYGLSTHAEQTLYLRGCTSATQPRKNLFSVSVNGISIRFCQKYFLGLHGITRARLRKKVTCFV